MIWDVMSYNGEKEILEIHLNALERYVDKFIIIEAKTTFSGHKKPLYFSLHEKHFEKFWPKIEYFVIDEAYSRAEINLAKNSPNTLGAAHWKREFLQKESIKKALIKNNVQDEDTVYIGDVDEIWEPIEVWDPLKLKLRVYAYHLNYRSNEVFWGTFVAKYKDIKDSCLNHLRSTTHIKTDEYYGWHFTSMGGLKQVRRKLDDSYTRESYNTSEVQKLLPHRFEAGQDYLGRSFKFQVDEEEWPTYLIKNRWKYTHMCK